MCSFLSKLGKKTIPPGMNINNDHSTETTAALARRLTAKTHPHPCKLHAEMPYLRGLRDIYQP